VVLSFHKQLEGLYKVLTHKLEILGSPKYLTPDSKLRGNQLKR